MQQIAYDRYLDTGHHAATAAPFAHPHAPQASPFAKDVLINARNVQVAPHLRNLYDHLMENHYLECIVGFDRSILNIFSRDVLERIRNKDATWETMVPAPVAAAIKKRGLFGHAA
jgi:hypothetical protein